MSIRKSIKKRLLATDAGNHLFYSFRRIREKVELSRESDLEYIQNTYQKRFGTEINLAEPRTFQEKLQWLKLFYRDPDMPVCSDKYRIREYLEQKGYGWLANEVIGVYTDARDIPFETLPQKFVAKATHGSGWNMICEDKNALDWPSKVKIMNDWLKLNLSVFGREWNYKDIQPRIIIEKYLDHKPLNDYKYMCFNGEPVFMQLNNDFEGKHYVDFYKIDGWEHVPCTYGPYVFSPDRIVEKPEQHERMMELARDLSKQFPFVRVDFYNFDETIVLGELTFFPGGGLWPFNPRDVGKSFDLEVGSCLQLPEPNHNLELLAQLKNQSR